MFRSCAPPETASSFLNELASFASSHERIHPGLEGKRIALRKSDQSLQVELMWLRPHAVPVDSATVRPR